MTAPVLEAACGCGHVRYGLQRAPVFRMICHCGICRRFNEAGSADILVFRRADLELPAEGRVAFGTYRPPPNVQRGRCARCEQPALELFQMPLLPRLAMVPRAMLVPASTIPSPKAHFFYDRRVADVDDTLPKHRGYLRSQAAFFRYLLVSR